MRDKKRIKLILYKFETMWDLYPDMRFCQMVSNLTRDLKDIFYLEDDSFEKRLDDELEKLLELHKARKDNVIS